MGLRSVVQGQARGSSSKFEGLVRPMVDAARTTGEMIWEPVK